MLPPGNIRKMENQILELLGGNDYTPANVPELLHQLGWSRNRQQELQRELRRLESSGRIARVKGNRYILPQEADLIPGRIRMNRAGKGFLLPDDPAIAEIAIPESATLTALHEDHVLVRRDRPQSKNTGTVIRVLERHRTNIVGTLHKRRQFLYVVPDDPRMPHDIYVAEPRDVGRPANIGDKVVVELRDWESRNSNPEGEIIEILGAPNDEGVDMLSVLRQYDLPLHFPKNVLAEARAIGSAVAPNELHGREDCRSHSVVTIDPDDAKDFDDAICLQRISTGEWKLWVHIADVSHYVKPGTALDLEAAKRGNSTYLVDRVIPMLPEALSNELCSLKPDVDRLTKCVEFLISNDGRVLAKKFYQAVIHSKRRFTYREVLETLQRPPVTDIERMLHDANELAQNIRRLRFKAGSLELDFPESKIRLDEKGRITRIETVENDISHQLIEEFMLLANEAVATRLMDSNVKAIYRVHEEPDERRLREYREEVLSHHVPCGNLSKPHEVQKLLQKLGTLPIGRALKIGFLKSLMRARYDVNPLGHYGLAKKKYTHFTSPIRRYADLVVHRALFQTDHSPGKSLKETAEHISETERNSADAERDSKDVKLFAFLNEQLASGEPQRYPALVTDLRNFGFFVDVTGLAMSGLVPLSTMDDDFYIYDEQRNHLIGRRTRRVIRLGDKLEVQVAKVDTVKKQVDFQLAVKPRDTSRAPFKTPQYPKAHQFPASSRQEQGNARRRRRR
jgi:ribonuclease R